jgi:hypothetical protein
MRSIIKSLVIASALVAGGSAFAGQSADSDLADAQAASRLAFITQNAPSGQGYRPFIAERSRTPFQAVIQQRAPRW